MYMQSWSFATAIRGRAKASKGGTAMNLMSDYGFLGWIVIGALAGIIAKAIMPGKDPGGCIVTILLGVAGALLAGFLGNALGWYRAGEGAGFIAAIIGAIIILFVYRLIAGRRRV
jgi:uncharacterized membrane protein YeaQ/YmgE (transglycosylase-associated protein family)